MKRQSDLVGLPVIALDTGNKIGRINKMIYSVQARKIEALVISKLKLMHNNLIIPYSEIVSIGSDSVTITSEHVLKRLADCPEIKVLQDEVKFNQQRLINPTGDFLGIIKDVVFDTHSGALMALDISDGLINDFLSGRVRLELPAKITLSQANCIYYGVTGGVQNSHEMSSMRKQSDGENNK